MFGLISLITVVYYSFFIAYAIAKKNINKAKLFYYCSFVWFVIVFLVAKFFPQGKEVTMQFAPIVAIFDKANGGKYLLDAIFSFVLFIPFGFLLSIFGTKREEEYIFIKILLFTLIVSICSELLQLIPLGKTVSTDHVIANTLGACVGYLLFAILSFGGKMKNVIKKIIE